MASIFGTGGGMLGDGMDPQYLSWFKGARKRLNQGMTPEIMKVTREPNRMGVSRETKPKTPTMFGRMNDGL